MLNGKVARHLRSRRDVADYCGTNRNRRVCADSETVRNRRVRAYIGFGLQQDAPGKHSPGCDLHPALNHTIMRDVHQIIEPAVLADFSERCECARRHHDSTQEDCFGLDTNSTSLSLEYVAASDVDDFKGVRADDRVRANENAPGYQHAFGDHSTGTYFNFVIDNNIPLGDMRSRMHKCRGADARSEVSPIVVWASRKCAVESMRNAKRVRCGH